jgi:hypothetical protein
MAIEQAAKESDVPIVQIWRNVDRIAAWSTKIKSMGAMTVAIANRGILGWPQRVAALIKSGTYLDCLASHVEKEKVVLANEPNMRHLARYEVLQIYEISEAPPW